MSNLLKRVNNVVVVSDLHCGCGLALCPPTVQLDIAGTYKASKLQRVVWQWWQEFWHEWVPMVTHGEPYAVVVNGDSVDGRHHGSVTQISQNLDDQRSIARTVLDPVVQLCEGRLYMVRGTEAHVGPSGENEETLASELNAVPDKLGHCARFDLWLEVGKRRGLCHFAHHIGTTGRTHYESSALMGELGEEYANAARWERKRPDVVVRSHRHRHIEVRVPTNRGYGIVFTTAGWQLKTPFTYRLPGGRVTEPQIGGSVIRYGDQDLYTRHWVKELERSETETPHYE